MLQNGPAASYLAIPLPCASPAAAALAGSGSCLLDDFQALIAPAVAAAGPAAAWCVACNATAPMPCKAVMLAALSEAAGGAEPVLSAAAAGWRWQGGVGSASSSWALCVAAAAAVLLAARV